MDMGSPKLWSFCLVEHVVDSFLWVLMLFYTYYPQHHRCSVTTLTAKEEGAGYLKADITINL